MPRMRHLGRLGCIPMLLRRGLHSDRDVLHGDSESVVDHVYGASHLLRDGHSFHPHPLCGRFRC